MATSALPQTMKAIRIHTPGGVEALSFDDIEVPKPSKGQILVQNKAAGLNFIDTYHRSGLYPLPPLPTIGVEGAGVVVEVGEDVNDFAVGDRVAYITRPPCGSYASFTTATAANAIRLPDSIPFEQGASILLQGMTAVSLATLAVPVKQGDVVLVHAAAGGTGRIIAAVSRHLGATVIGTVSTEEKAAVAREAGCHHVLLYTKQNVAEEVMKITHGKGATVSFDGVGKDTFQVSLDALGKNGTLVSFGNASGKVPPVDIFVLVPKHLKLMRTSLFGFISTAEEFKALSSRTLELVTSGVVKLEIFKTFPLDQVAEAHKTLEGRLSTGKIVILP